MRLYMYILCSVVRSSLRLRMSVLARLASAWVVFKLRTTVNRRTLRHTGLLGRRVPGSPGRSKAIAAASRLSPKAVAMPCHRALPPVDSASRICGNLADQLCRSEQAARLLASALCEQLQAVSSSAWLLPVAVLCRCALPSAKVTPADDLSKVCRHLADLLHQSGCEAVSQSLISSAVVRTPLCTSSEEKATVAAAARKGTASGGRASNIQPLQFEYYPREYCATALSSLRCHSLGISLEERSSFAAATPEVTALEGETISQPLDLALPPPFDHGFDLKPRTLRALFGLADLYSTWQVSSPSPFTSRPCHRPRLVLAAAIATATAAASALGSAIALAAASDLRHRLCPRHRPCA